MPLIGDRSRVRQFMNNRPKASNRGQEPETGGLCLPAGGEIDMVRWDETMKGRLGLLVAILVLPACGGLQRIQKMPVPRQDLLHSYQLMAEGDELALVGKPHFALLKYLEASSLNPYHEVIFNKLAITYSRLSQYRQAQRAVERAIRLEPDYPYAYNTEGIIHLANRLEREAIESFRRAVSLMPNEANFYVNLGHAYMKAGQYDRGLEAYRQGLALDPAILSRDDVIELSYQTPEDPDPERLYQMARVFADLGNRETCLEYLEKALSAGFSDGKRLLQDDAFTALLEDSDFVRLISLYGIKKTNS